MPAADREMRFEVPLYTLGEASMYLGMPATTFRNWALGYSATPTGRRTVRGDPILTVVGEDRRRPTVPFIALAEGMVLAAIRKSGVPLQRIRPALAALRSEMNLEYALASRKLYTDGAEVLYDFASETSDRDVSTAVKQLVVLRNNQRVFTEVVQDYLRRIEHDNDGWARLVRLPTYPLGGVVVDPTRSFGKPIFERGGVRVSDVLSRFLTGESVDDLVEEFGVPEEHIEDAIRVAAHAA